MSEWDYRGARYYSADYGRFLSVVDPLHRQFSGWSPYSYVFANPISLIDLKGEAPINPPGISPPYFGKVTEVKSEVVSIQKFKSGNYKIQERVTNITYIGAVNFVSSGLRRKTISVTIAAQMGVFETTTNIGEGGNIMRTEVTQIGEYKYASKEFSRGLSVESFQMLELPFGDLGGSQMERSAMYFSGGNLNPGKNGTALSSLVSTILTQNPHNFPLKSMGDVSAEGEAGFRKEKILAAKRILLVDQ